MSGWPTPGSTGAHGEGRARPARHPGRVLGAVGAAAGVVAGVVVGVVALPLVLAAPSAAAAPPTPTAGASPADQPVAITLTGIEPRTVTPGATITLTGRLSNTGEQTITHLQLRLQRGRVMGSRAELTAADKDPDPATAVVAPFSSLPGQAQLEPGDSTPFSYSLPAAALQLDQDGVYPALLNANGTVAGGTRRVGELSTYLVAPPSTGIGHTQVAWLWPLVDRTHRNAEGRFTDDELAREITGNGRLDRALSVLEKLPRTPLPGGGTAPAVPVTLAIDPALIEELQIMAAGPYPVGTATGTGTQAAASFLQRLKAVAAGQTVVALPYGDVDAGALEAAGLAQVITRSLPGTSGGTAHDDRFTGVSGTPGGTTGQDAGKDSGEGADLLAQALGVRPRTDTGWLPDGPVAAATLATYQQGGADRFVVSSSALTEGDRALGLDATPAAAHAGVAGSGALDALVGDTELGGLADERRTAGGPRVGEQRYLAELTLLSMRAPADPAAGAATVLAVPPREVDASPDDVVAMMTDATQQPWLQPAALDAVAGAPAAPAGALVSPPATATLDPVGMAAVASAVSAREDLAGAAAGDPTAALAPYDAAIARTTSLAWLDQPGPFRTAARALAQAVGELRDRVALVAPADGTYTLASNDAPLVLTVRNDLPFAVRVLLRLGSRGAAGVDPGNIGEQTLAPGSRTILQVPTHLQRSGGFTVIATVTTPSGRPLGDPVQIKVKSTAYGSVSLIITIGAAVLLGLLFLRRLVRFALRRRGGPKDDFPGPSAEGAAVPLPPTRSPV